MINFIIGMVVGLTIGIFIMAAVYISKNGDDK